MGKSAARRATFYVWRKKFAGLMPSAMKWLRQLEAENARLKRLVADLSLDKEMLQDTAWFMSLDDARSKCEAWRRDYKEQRPRSAIGDKCPIELMNGAGPYGPPGA